MKVDILENHRELKTESNRPIAGLWPIVLAVVGLMLTASLLLVRHVGVIGQATLGQQSSLMLWVYWWPSQATWLNQDLMITDYAGFPFKQNLLPFLSPLLTVVYQSVQWLTPPLAFNLLFGLGLGFTAAAMLSYLHYRHVPLTLAVGLTFFVLISPVMQYHLSQGRPDLFMLGWIPLGCLFLDRARWQTQGWFGLAATAIGATLTSVPLAFAAVMVWLIYAAVELLTAKPMERDRIVTYLLWQFLIMLAVWMIYPLPGLLKTLAGIAPDVTATLPVPLEWSVSVGIGLLSVLWVGLIGYAVLLRGDRPSRVWAGIGAVCLAIAALQHFGVLPFLTPLTPPSVWWAAATIAFGLFVALSFAPRWESHWQHNAHLQVAGVAVLLVGAVALSPMPPTISWHSTNAYQAIGQERGNYAILDVPYGIRSLTSGNQFGNGANFQHYATLHHQRTLNGTLTGLSAPAFTTATNSAVLSYLAAEPTTATDAAIAAELKTLIERHRIGYLVVHLQELYSNRQTDMLKFLNNQTETLCQVSANANTVVYRTTWHPYNCQVSLGSS